MRVMHCGPVEFCSMLRASRAASRQRPVIALSVIEMMVDVTVEMFRPVEPGTRADEYAA